MQLKNCPLCNKKPRILYLSGGRKKAECECRSVTAPHNSCIGTMWNTFADLLETKLRMEK